MDIINFDELQGAKRDHKHHPLIPDCHFMILGPTGCGKTNLLLNMLLKYMNFDSCVIYTINEEQGKYAMLAGLSNLLREKLEIDDFVTIKRPDEVVPVDSLDSTTDKVIVFDDIRIDRANMDKIKEYFSLSRNKRCNCIYLAQSYYDVPKYIRRNTKCFVLFGGFDNRDIREMCSDNSRGISRHDLEQLYRDATAERHSFLVIDKTADTLPECYRKWIPSSARDDN